MADTPATSLTLNRAALAIAAALTLVAVIAGVAAVLRWERVVEVRPGVPLPRGAQLLESVFGVGERDDICRFQARVRGEPRDVRPAYEALLAQYGWTRQSPDAPRDRFASGDRSLTIGIGRRAQEAGWSRLRLQLRPCAR